ncbi:MAG: hypothetical protein FJY34_06770 [Betaproteobacteria bacterium]|nr:hypothetical protein [Betaproteobacteria bacterium]
MKSILALITLLALSAQAAFADGGFEDVRARLFNEFRNIESVSHRERIAILQEAEACIQAATNREQYRICEERENAARERSNDKAKASRQALKARVEQMRQSFAMNRP